MKPYIKFTVELNSRVPKSTIRQLLLTICPFDHLYNEVRRKNHSSYDIQVFFQESEYLETSHQMLEKKAKKMAEKLDSQLPQVGKGKVIKIKIGVIS